MYTVSQEQLDSFAKNGYLIIRYEDHKLFDIKDVQNWTKEIEGWEKPVGKWMPYDEINSKGERQVMRVENFMDYHDKYNALIRGQGILEILQQLNGKEMYLFKDKINFKYANGGGFGAHIDAPAYRHIKDIKHLTCNLAIDAATPENGCLEFVNGSHKMDVEIGENLEITPEWEKSHEWTLGPLNAGDLVFFGSYLAHRSAPNKTDSSRRQLYATYHDGEEKDSLRTKYYDDRAKAFPPDHLREKGKDYSKGFHQYAFAAPYTHASDDEKDNEARVAPAVST